MDDRGKPDFEPDLLDLLARIDALADASEIPALLHRLLQLYDLKSVAYLGSGITGRPDEGPYLAVTYSPEWVEHYKAAGFVSVDPAIQIGLRRMLPIDWSQFSRENERVRRLFGEAIEFGLGRHGMSLPVHGRHGDRALLSVTSNAGDRDWKRLRVEYMRDFQLLALHLHQSVVHLTGSQVPDVVRLSPRERECLMWAGEGKTEWETAMILGLTKSTVRFYLESARHKLRAANRTHAVKKAEKANLLGRFP